METIICDAKHLPICADCIGGGCPFKVIGLPCKCDACTAPDKHSIEQHRCDVCGGSGHGEFDHQKGKFTYREGSASMIIIKDVRLTSERAYQSACQRAHQRARKQ
ncbi:MAG: hypothetical protein Satyrvirus1_53 [Satyrvirus sp.]|uniref:Uncharacterized protein n=1 Tax=Satyrvirus sp. TaxID=2487771 RepID=A0A3G5ACT8_9VIRU|nr:MAG: hypothetical protein Satyrvirus1_53 [Satyrvirus sp.]